MRFARPFDPEIHISLPHNESSTKFVERENYSWEGGYDANGTYRCIPFGEGSNGEKYYFLKRNDKGEKYSAFTECKIDLC